MAAGRECCLGVLPPAAGRVRGPARRTRAAVPSWSAAVSVGWRGAGRGPRRRRRIDGRRATAGSRLVFAGRTPRTAAELGRDRRRVGRGGLRRLRGRGFRRVRRRRGRYSSAPWGERPAGRSWAGDVRRLLAGRRPPHPGLGVAGLRVVAARRPRWHRPSARSRLRVPVGPVLVVVVSRARRLRVDWQTSPSRGRGAYEPALVSACKPVLGRLRAPVCSEPPSSRTSTTTADAAASRRAPALATRRRRSQGGRPRPRASRRPPALPSGAGRTCSVVLSQTSSPTGSAVPVLASRPAVGIPRAEPDGADVGEPTPASAGTAWAVARRASPPAGLGVVDLAAVGGLAAAAHLQGPERRPCGRGRVHGRPRSAPAQRDRSCWCCGRRCR